MVVAWVRNDLFSRTEIRWFGVDWCERRDSNNLEETALKCGRVVIMRYAIGLLILPTHCHCQ